MSDSIHASPSSLSVIVPAYNEQDRLAGTLPDIYQYYNERCTEWELLVVDDGSTDATASLVAEFAETHPAVRLISYGPNRGKGHAVRTGMLAAQYDVVLFMDADLATPLEETWPLLEAIRAGADMAIGSRACHGAVLEVRQPWYRELAGRSFNLVVQLLAAPGIHDTQCGFKMLTATAVQQVFIPCREDGFSFDIEAIHVARRLGLTIRELPVHWRHVEGSRVSLLRDGLRMLRDIPRIVRRHRALRTLAHESG